MKDATGYTLIPRKFERIVSLVPSQTELLCDLGVTPVGRTRFCEHADASQQARLEQVTVVGGTKDFSAAKIRALRPDLVLANKEENVAEPLLELRQDIPVWTTEVKTLTDALKMMQDVGQLIQKEDSATQMIESVRKAFTTLHSPQHRKRVLYLIWKNPWMSVGQDTFIHDMLGQCGWQNVITTDRYPALSDEALVALNPELILLSSEPFPFKEKHVAEVQTLCPEARVIQVDGALFSWYGSRLREAPDYFKSLRSAVQT